MLRKNPYRPLERALGYGFRKRKRLEMALTHPSFRYESPETDEDNQRLEFLGDAVLGLITAAYLYSKHTGAHEGDLTRLRSLITNRTVLSHMAKSIRLGTFLKLGKGEKETGGESRASNLSDAIEAVIGAAYLDGGLKAAEKIFKKIFIPQLERILQGGGEDDNPKGRLQELSQRQWKLSPRYRIIHEDGPAHSRVFTVEVMVGSQIMGSGEGLNKRAAEMEAARHAIELFDKNKPVEGNG